MTDASIQSNRIAGLRKKTGLSQRAFAKHYDIPVRTLQQWEQGKSSPPAYVIAMMEKLLPAPVTAAETLKPPVDPYFIPERTRWKVCIERPFPGCERVYPTQQRKVRELLDDISRCPSVKSVTVFGSSVTQRCHIGSDVDLYVELEKNVSPLQQPHNFPIDLWTNYTADQRLIQEIEKTGFKVYGQ